MRAVRAIIGGVGGVAVAFAVLAAAGRPVASAASDEECRKFHQECADAKALGYEDAGICNVERQECPSPPAGEPAEGVGKRTPRPLGGGEGDVRDPERSIGP